MSRIKKRVMTIFFTIVMCIAFCFGVVACSKTDLTPLGKVSLTIDNSGLATWEEVDNASRYAYVINDEDLVETTLRAVQLANGDKIKVKAIGDGVTYSDGNYCAPQRYTAASPVKLGDVTVTFNECVATWSFVDGASRYAYILNGEAPVETTAKALVLRDGDTIQVKAVGDGVYYIDGDYSAEVTYTAPTQPSTPPAVVEPELPAEQIRVVVKKTIESTESITLGDIALPTGFAWADKTTSVQASGDFDATYTDDNGTLDVKVYIDLTINEKTEEPVPPATVPEYTTIVVTKTITDGDTITLADVKGLPTGFAWKTPSTPVTASDYFDATYTDENGTAAARVYVDLTIEELPAQPEEPQEPVPSVPVAPEFLAVVEKTIAEGTSITLADVTGLPQGFAWKTTSTAVTASGFFAATYTDENGTVDARIYIDLTIRPADVEPQKLGDVEVTIKGHTASWSVVENASRYAYQINDGEVVETTLCSVTLNAGESIKVKAIGDGEAYADGDYCAEVKHNTIYDKEIYEGPVALTINGLETIDGATASGTIAFRTEDYVKSHGNKSYCLAYTQDATLTIPMLRNGSYLPEAQLRLFSALRLSVFVSGDDLWCDAAKANAPEITIGNKTYTVNDWVAGWNDIAISVEDFLASGSYTGTITIKIHRPLASNYVIYVDNLAGIYTERLNLGNTMVFGDSYSTYKGYIHDPRFFYYADSPVSTTDVNDVSQTWWGQVIANTDSNLIMNDAISGSTVSGVTYTSKWDASPQDCFVKRMDALISGGYFTQNQVDTILMFGGTNDSWGGNALGTAMYSGWTKTDLEKVLPAFCYFISKALQNTQATVVVVLNTYENMGNPVIPYYRGQFVDYQTPIINAVKGFAEYGTRVQIVALNNNEYNNPDTSLGDHPTKAGMTAIKDQILHTLYERKYLSAEQWTKIGNVSADAPKETVLNDFSSDIDNLRLGDATATKNATNTADGNGSWAVKPNGSTTAYVICYITDSLSTYDALKFVVYANSSAAGKTLYLDSNLSVALGILAEGKNEFTIAASSVPLANQWGNYVAVFFAISDANAVIFFDSLIGITN